MSAEIIIKTDVFPLKSRGLNVKPTLVPLHFNRLSTRYELKPFIAYLDKTEKDKVRYRAMPCDGRLKEHFEKMDKTFDKNPRGLGWASIEKRLLNKATDKQNIDCRQSYKFDNNFFVVKNLFTTGLREVEAGTRHCYHVGSNPITLYTVTKEVARLKRIKTHPRSFVPAEQYCFTKYDLEANTFYVLPRNIYYVVCTYTPAYFAIYVLDEPCPFSFPVSFIEPTKPILRKAAILSKFRSTSQSKVDRVKRKPDLYDRPPATPFYDSIRVVNSEEGHTTVIKKKKISLPPPPPASEEVAMPPPPPPPPPFSAETTPVSSPPVQTSAPAPSAPTQPEPTVRYFEIDPKVIIASPEDIMWFHQKAQRHYDDPSEPIVEFDSNSTLPSMLEALNLCQREPFSQEKGSQCPELEPIMYPDSPYVPPCLTPHPIYSENVFSSIHHIMNDVQELNIQPNELQMGYV